VTPAQQLAGFIAKYTPAIQRDFKKALAAMRKRLPGAVELVYDNYNALVVGFGPSEKSSHAVFSAVAYPKWVTLFFLQGRWLRDPHGLLQGQGNVVRSIVLKTPDVLGRPEVQELIDEALLNAPAAIDPKQPRRLVIKSISTKQRPRRPS
jgi:hypothetical protein